MAAKVRFNRGAWWVFTHHAGKRTKQRLGPTKADRRRAEKIAEQITARLALGEYEHPRDRKRAEPLSCAAALRGWRATYSPTMKPSYRNLTDGMIEKHLAPFFGERDVTEIREADLLDFTRAKLAEGLAPKTIRNCLSTLRRVLTLL